MMTTPSPTDVEQRFLNAQRQVRRHWYADGIAELAVGGTFAIIGFYLAATAAMAPLVRGRHVLVPVLLNLAFPALVIFLIICVRRLASRAKERLVFPRTGFVSFPRQRTRPRWLAGLIAGGVSGLTVALVKTAPGAEAWIPAAQGFLLAAGAHWLARATGVPRFTLLGLFAALVGVSVSLAHTDAGTDGALFFGLFGVATAATGAVVLRRFLRESPPPEEA